MVKFGYAVFVSNRNRYYLYNSVIRITLDFYGCCLRYIYVFQ